MYSYLDVGGLPTILSIHTSLEAGFLGHPSTSGFLLLGT